VKAAVEMLADLAFVLAPNALFVVLLGVPLDVPGAYAFLFARDERHPNREASQGRVRKAAMNQDGVRSGDSVWRGRGEPLSFCYQPTFLLGFTRSRLLLSRKLQWTEPGSIVGLMRAKMRTTKVTLIPTTSATSAAVASAARR